MATITIYKGNPYSATITVTDSTGAAYDLTGKTVFFTVKYKHDDAANDTAALITKTITSHTDAAGGITTLALTAAQTAIAVGDYKFDFRVYDDSPLVQLNSVAGTCTVTDVVTKRTS